MKCFVMDCMGERVSDGGIIASLSWGHHGCGMSVMCCHG